MINFLKLDKKICEHCKHSFRTNHAEINKAKKLERIGMMVKRETEQSYKSIGKPRKGQMSVKFTQVRNEFI